MTENIKEQKLVSEAARKVATEFQHRLIGVASVEKLAWFSIQFPDALGTVLDRFAEDTNKRWECPECGYKHMPWPPKDYHICPHCMVEFGNDDRKTNLEFRVHQLEEALSGLMERFKRGLLITHAVPDEATAEAAVANERAILSGK